MSHQLPPKVLLGTGFGVGDYGYDWQVYVCPQSPMGDVSPPSMSFGTILMVGAVGVGLWLALKKR